MSTFDMLPEDIIFEILSYSIDKPTEISNYYLNKNMNDVIKKFLLIYNLNFNFSNCNKITDVGIIKIAENCKNIQTINLSCCYNITDTSIIKLAENCKNIQAINLAQCENISRDCLIYLKEKYKNILNIEIEINKFDYLN
jgi:hypothetical protein